MKHEIRVGRMKKSEFHINILFYATDIKFYVPIKWQYGDNLWHFSDIKMTKLNQNSQSTSIWNENVT